MSPNGAYTFSGNVAPYGTETGQHQGLLAQASALAGVGLTDRKRLLCDDVACHTSIIRVVDIPKESDHVIMDCSAASTAARVRTRSSSVWASETNAASKGDGAR